MPLPWVRLESNIATHDKILNLVSDPSPKRWQAAASYMLALAWSGGQGTNGRIPVAALPFVHGTHATARLLVKYDLWEERPGAWQIHNWDRYQLNTDAAEHLANRRRFGAVKSNCRRWHGPGCWDEETGCARSPS